MLNEQTGSLADQLSALIADMAEALPDAAARTDLAAALAGLALEVPEDLNALSGLLNLARAATIAPSAGTPAGLVTGLGQAIEGTLTIARNALDHPDTATANQQMDQASTSLMMALMRFQSGEPPIEPAVVAAAAAPVARPYVLLPEDRSPEIMAEFIAECRDYIHKSEAALLVLETDPSDKEAVNTVFRAFHTIKGTAGFVGIEPLTELAHRAETLLSRVRDGKIQYGGHYADLALQSTDMLEELMQALEQGLRDDQHYKPDGYDELLDQLDHPDDVYGLPPLTMRVGDIVVGAQLAERHEVERALNEHPAKPVGEALVQSGVVSATNAAQALRAQQKVESDSTVDNTLRVRMDKLDKLIDTVSELVIAQSMVAQDGVIQDGAYYDLTKKVTHAGKLVRELQTLSMTMRMVPLRATFQKMNRLVRDVSRKSGKQVVLVTEGDEVEIDRNMVDAITDPLVHMVRNSVDHGIEPAEERLAAGKPEQGTVRLIASHSEGNVVVRIQDDGRGLDPEKIVRKAISKGLIDPHAQLNEAQVFDLLFLPGFSTAEQVTELSGRGVGMDVVKRNVQSIGGHIGVASELGHGSTFSLYMPLTLAVTDGMLVQVGQERYILPTRSISISFRPLADTLSTVNGQGEMVVFRERLLPILRLHRVFNVPDAITNPAEGLLVIVDDGQRQFAMLVDAVLGQHQVVTKPLGNALGKVAGVAGTAILGDGRVGLILDVPGVTALAHTLAAAGRHRREPALV